MEYSRNDYTQGAQKMGLLFLNLMFTVRKNGYSEQLNFSTGNTQLFGYMFRLYFESYYPIIIFGSFRFVSFFFSRLFVWFFFNFIKLVFSGDREVSSYFNTNISTLKQGQLLNVTG